MPLTRDQKSLALEFLKEQISQSGLVMFLNFHGLDSGRTTLLRQGLRGQRVTLTVAKKTLLRRALGELADIDGERPALPGEVAVAHVPAQAVDPTDPLAAARLVYGFVKQWTEQLKILGGVVQRRYHAGAELTALAQIPGRTELLGQLLGVLTAPLRKLVLVCAAAAKKQGA